MQWCIILNNYVIIDRSNDRSNDVLNIIFNKLPLVAQIRFRATCKKLREKLDITNLYNIPYKLRKRSTNTYY
jgi:hypothetical protein